MLVHYYFYVSKILKQLPSLACSSHGLSLLALRTALCTLHQPQKNRAFYWPRDAAIDLRKNAKSHISLVYRYIRKKREGERRILASDHFPAKTPTSTHKTSSCVITHCKSARTIALPRLSTPLGTLLPIKQRLATAVQLLNNTSP